MSCRASTRQSISAGRRYRCMGCATILPRGALQRWAQSKRVGAKRAWEQACDMLLDPRRSVLHLTSQMEADESAPRIRKAKPVVIENGVDAPELLPARDWRPNGQLRLLY